MSLQLISGICLARFSAELDMSKSKPLRGKFVQLVAGLDRSKIQSIGANGISFMNAERIARR